MSEATARISKVITIVGMTGAVLAIATVVLSTILYVQDHDFSIFRTYLSDIGGKTGWPQVVFNSGMLIIAPVRYLFLVFLILQLKHLGAGKGFSLTAYTIGALVVIGSVGIAAIPYSLNLALHKMSALLYFFATVALQSLIGIQEWKRRLPKVLPASSFGVVFIYFIFAILFSMAGKIEGVTRSTPVIWEWLAFCSLMFWLIAHALVLGDPRGKKD